MLGFPFLNECFSDEASKGAYCSDGILERVRDAGVVEDAVGLAVTLRTSAAFRIIKRANEYTSQFQTHSHVTTNTRL